jgi:hypothetical protein
MHFNSKEVSKEVEYYVVPVRAVEAINVEQIECVMFVRNLSSEWICHLEFSGETEIPLEICIQRVISDLQVTCLKHTKTYCSSERNKR